MASAGLTLAALAFANPAFAQHADDDASKGTARPVTPLNQAEWARRIIEGYPVEALRTNAQGTVGVTLTIDTQGRAAACKVRSSSGHQSLDNAACGGMIEHARFTPAIGDDGEPTTGNWSTNVVYSIDHTYHVLPGDSPPA